MKSSLKYADAEDGIIIAAVYRHHAGRGQSGTESPYNRGHAMYFRRSLPDFHRSDCLTRVCTSAVSRDWFSDGRRSRAVYPCLDAVDLGSRYLHPAS